MSKSGWTIFPSLNVGLLLWKGRASFSNSFTAKAIQPLGFISINLC
jgi:hypothetical protein